MKSELNKPFGNMGNVGVRHRNGALPTHSYCLSPFTDLQAAPDAKCILFYRIGHRAPTARYDCLLDECEPGLSNLGLNSDIFIAIGNPANLSSFEGCRIEGFRGCKGFWINAWSVCPRIECTLGFEQITLRLRLDRSVAVSRGRWPFSCSSANCTKAAAQAGLQGRLRDPGASEYAYQGSPFDSTDGGDRCGRKVDPKSAAGRGIRKSLGGKGASFNAAPDATS